MVSKTIKHGSFWRCDIRGRFLEEKIKVYICSMKEIPTLDFVDKDSMGHPCVTSRHDICSGLKNLPKGSWNGYLTGEQIKILDVVNEFCEKNGLEYEVVDIANLSFVRKTKLVFKGIKAPTIIFKKKRIEGVPTKEDLRVLIAE